jgi:putative flavoprotein involved in K+ transport
VPDEPGLFFVGLQFQYAATSDVFPGVGRDAEYIADQIATRVRSHEASSAPMLHAA